MTREKAIKVIKEFINGTCLHSVDQEALETLIPELKESEDEGIRKQIIKFIQDFCNPCDPYCDKWIAYLKKQKENPKSSDSIPPDCTSDVKCEDRWHKVGDSLPDDGRLVLAKDCLGNVLLARYDGENWEVNVYDNEDHYCHNSISKWCEIPSEKQKEQKPWKVGANAYFTPEQKPAEFTHHETNESLQDAVTHQMEDDGDVDDFVRRGIDDIALKYAELGAKWQKEQKQEWSEEDEKYLNRVINLWVNDFGEDSDTIKWLKSLRPSWKPSEEELAKKHLDGYCMGREDTLREMKDFVESHFTHREYKSPECGTCASAWNTASGTSTLKAEE